MLPSRYWSAWSTFDLGLLAKLGNRVRLEPHGIEEASGPLDGDDLADDPRRDRELRTERHGPASFRKLFNNSTIASVSRSQ